MTYYNPVVYVANGAFSYAVREMFARAGFRMVGDPHKAGIIVWTGGADIDPKLYGSDDKAKLCGVSRNHDAEDLALWELVKNRKDALFLGICRGGQFLNVMYGKGSMWQHVDKHGGTHNALCTLTNKTVSVSSLHHQMMKPGPNAHVFLTAKVSTYKQYENDVDTEGEDIEGIMYDGRVLCYQPHPEIDKNTERHFMSIVMDMFQGKYNGKAAA